MSADCAGACGSGVALEQRREVAGLGSATHRPLLSQSNSTAATVVVRRGGYTHLPSSTTIFTRSTSQPLTEAVRRPTWHSPAADAGTTIHRDTLQLLQRPRSGCIPPLPYRPASTVALASARIS